MATTTPASVSLDEFRSPADHKRYRVVTLPNGLEALLVQNDPSAAASDDGAPDASEEREPEHEPVPSNSRARRYSFFSTASDASDTGDDDGDDEGGNSDEDGDAAPANTHHAAACLTVGVGSMADPKDVRGLAHYLEHMLFMGSEKYPDENAFEAFLSTHGGYSNGATECESTRFLFEIGARHLQPALDMFAQFFIAPLFKPEALERELLAVESEFNRARQNDYVRLQQIQCATCAPGHAYDSFSWGNRESLQTIPAAKGIDVRDAMIAFYRRYYAPRAMKLCVYGEDSLDDMEQWVFESFGKIPHATQNDDDSTPPLPSVPFGVAVGQEPALVKVVPVHKMHIMHVYWQLPPLLASYKQKPWEYLSHALGHEGEGSITAVLKERGWGTYVTVGISESDGYEFGSFGSLFEVGITLTREGVAHWADVVHVIFDALDFVGTQPSGMQPWIFDELKTSTEMAFLFMEQLEPINVCRRLSHLLQTRHGVDRRDLLRYDTMQGDFDEPQTRMLLEYMTPRNTRVVVLSHLFGDQQESPEWRAERWFGAKYSLSPIPNAVLERWRTPSGQDELRDPCRNPFMPKSFDVIQRVDAESDTDDCGAGGVCSSSDDGRGKRASAPSLVHTTHLSKLWFKQDDAFFVPKTNANFLLCLPAITRSVADYVCARIYVKLVNDALKQVYYQANNANLEFELAIRDLDLEVTFAGFSDSLGDLVRVVFRTLVDAPILPATFALMRDELAREYRNLNLKPSMKARYLRLQLLERTSFSVEDSIRALADVQMCDVARFRDAVMWRDGDVTLRSLVHGNSSRDDAIALQLSVESILSARMLQALPQSVPVPPKTPTRPHTTELPLTANGILLRDMSEHDEETNSAVEVYYQIGKCGYEHHAYALLLNQIMQEPLFHHLRTIQQLGYEVYCCVRDTHGVLGFSIAVQSASHASGDIAVRIDSFVHAAFLQHLQELSAKTFAAHVATLQRHKSRPDAQLSAETDRYWEAIQSRRFDFFAEREIVAALDRCTLPGLIECYGAWLLANGESDADGGARKLRVHVVGKSSHFVPLEKLVAEDDAPVIVKSLHEYKKTLTCHC
ncbi:hypothetical protein PybrP1_011397 [[Pythium] brassicae (nom. inval.)]|nr:hypothetical protein PybrP1_011397 [[Pythium] brassicae (nom. inval.)]